MALLLLLYLMWITSYTFFPGQIDVLATLDDMYKSFFQHLCILYSVLFKYMTMLFHVFVNFVIM